MSTGATTKKRSRRAKEEAATEAPDVPPVELAPGIIVDVAPPDAEPCAQEAQATQAEEAPTQEIEPEVIDATASATSVTDSDPAPVSNSKGKEERQFIVVAEVNGTYEVAVIPHLAECDIPKSRMTHLEWKKFCYAQDAFVYTGASPLFATVKVEEEVTRDVLMTGKLRRIHGARISPRQETEDEALPSLDDIIRQGAAAQLPGRRPARQDGRLDETPVAKRSVAKKSAAKKPKIKAEKEEESALNRPDMDIGEDEDRDPLA